MNESYTQWGADYEAWTHFAIHLGLIEDLLPVVSNLKATISPNSALKKIGKVPSVYNHVHQVVGIPTWTMRVTQPQDISTWRDEPDYGICIQTRKVRALDIDIPNTELATEIVGFIELLIGHPLPRRWRSDSGKCLLMFRLTPSLIDDKEYSKRVLRLADGIIEFLATGQQFIACATHEDGERYQWDHGALPESIPELSPSDFELLWAALASTYATEEARERQGQRPALPRHASDAQDGMVDFLLTHNFVAKQHPDGRVDILCPWAHEHTSENESSTSYFPAGVGGFQQGHFKCLHSHCAHRTDIDFSNAFGYEASQFAPVIPEGFDNTDPVVVPGGNVAPPKVVSMELTRNKQGIINTATNTLRMLAHTQYTGFHFCYDTFRAQVLIRSDVEQEWRPLRDSDYINVHSLLERRGMHKPAGDLIKQAILRTAEENTIDTAIQWGDSLVWDGVPRIATFFPHYFRTVDNDYTRACGSYWWTALAGRMLTPGIQADMTPVLVGGQGVGKTQGIKAMCPIVDSYLEIDLAQRDEDTARKMRGKLIGDLNELRGLRSRDAEAIKAWMTRTHDEWTPKYMEFAIKMHRRVGFIGTANGDEILNDEEERRWLPMRCGDVLVEKIKKDREQLWAEGIAMFKENGIAWRAAQTLAVNEHASFKVRDDWSHSVEQWLAVNVMDERDSPCRGEMPFTSADVLTGALRIPLDRIRKTESDRIARILRNLSYKYLPYRDNTTSTGLRYWAKNHDIE